jgi:hypothetical protein
MGFTTTKAFERRSKIDNQLQVSIPVGTRIEAEHLFNDQYEITADKPITKNNDNSIYVSKRELDSMES